MRSPRIRLFTKTPDGSAADHAETVATRALSPPLSSPSKPNVNPVLRKCRQIVQGIKELQGENGEQVCELFLDLPSAQDYPDYYAVIKKPMAIKNLQEKIRRAKYQTIELFMKDVDIMVENAKTYNQPESYICKAANKIRDYVAEQVEGFERNPDAILASPTKSAMLGQSGKVGGTGSKDKKRRNAHKPQTQEEDTDKSSRGMSAVAQGYYSPLMPAPGEVRRKRTDPGYETGGDVQKHTRVKKMKLKVHPSSAGAVIKLPEGQNAGEAEEEMKEGESDELSLVKLSASMPVISKGEAARLDLLFKHIIHGEKHAAIELASSRSVNVNAYRLIPSELLAELGVDEDDIDPESPPSWTPLHAAAFYGRPRVIEAIVMAGADVEAVDTLHGSTAVSWGAYGGHRVATKQIVRKWGAKINVQNRHGQGPLDLVPDPDDIKWREFLDPAFARSSATTAALSMPARPPAPTSPSTVAPPAAVRARQAQQTQTKTVVSPSLSPSPKLDAMAAPTLPSGLTQSLEAMPAPDTAGLITTTPTDMNAPVNGVARTTFNKALAEILDAVVSAKDSDGEDLAEVFMDLPNRDEYPEYYEVIPYPMALNVVRRKIGVGYHSLGNFEIDMIWIFHNATFFNEQGSEIYNNAIELETRYRKIRSAVVKKYNIQFDVKHADEKPKEGRYVPRTVWGDMNICVGDFLYIKPPGDKQSRIALVRRLRVSGIHDRKKHIEGIWFLKPREITLKDEAGPMHFYPHEVVLDKQQQLEDISARCIVGKCFVLPIQQYVRAYPKGSDPSHVYVCERVRLSSGEIVLIDGKWEQLTETLPVNPPPLLPYSAAPLSLTKQPVSQWDNPALLPQGGRPLSQTIPMQPSAMAAQTQPFQLHQQQRQRQQQRQQQLPPMVPQQQAQQPRPLNTAAIVQVQQMMQANQATINQLAATPPNQMAPQELGMLRQLQQRQWHLQQMLRTQQQSQQISSPGHPQMTLNTVPHTFQQQQQQQQQLMPRLQPVAATQASTTTNFYEQSQQLQRDIASLSRDDQPGLQAPHLRPPMPLTSNAASPLRPPQSQMVSSPYPAASVGNIGGSMGVRSPQLSASTQYQVRGYPGVVSSPLGRMSTSMSPIVSQHHAPPPAGHVVSPSPSQSSAPVGGRVQPRPFQAQSPIRPEAQQQAQTQTPEQWAKMFGLFQTVGNSHLANYDLPPTLSLEHLQQLRKGRSDLTNTIEHVQLASIDQNYFLHVPLNALRALHSINLPLSATSVFLRPIFATMLAPISTSSSSGNSPALNGGGLAVPSPGQQQVPIGMIGAKLNGKLVTCHRMPKEQSQLAQQQPDSENDVGKQSSVVWSKDHVFQLALLPGLNMVELMFKHPSGAMPLPSPPGNQQQQGVSPIGTLRQSLYCFFITRC
ncbi:hypothetical protein EV182_000801 [Spiromyces aspiralis]|uniref:Uncharacterized protein n=1 Tax=Spiromyces aspiralis TaxID=68401 RepID=A0ACC1HWJ8_9FUNG|nr:hypothetical protein EV182_000801 [Spiromyces aspiralis]